MSVVIDYLLPWELGDSMEAAEWRIRKYGTWLATGAGIAVACSVGFELIRIVVGDQDWLHVAANLYLATIAVVVISFSAYRQWNTIRKEKYANITPIIHQLLHQIRDINTVLQANQCRSLSQTEYKHVFDVCKLMFGRVLDQVNAIFTSITSTHCRTSIKLLYPVEGKIYIVTFSRNQGAKQAWMQLDKNRFELRHDPLVDNPQFFSISSDTNQSWYYICNDLPRDPSFLCTSVTAYKPEHATRAVPPPGKRPEWPLPYKSTIACVIRQAPVDVDGDIPSEVIGFLTVDSESRGVFSERWDVPLMLGIADALFTPLQGYLSAQNRAESTYLPVPCNHSSLTPTAKP
jgi:hypothetical protein